MNKETFERVGSLLIELGQAEKEYYDNRTLLGFSLPGEITDQARAEMELKMPLLESRIKDIRDELESITQGEN